MTGHPHLYGMLPADLAAHLRMNGIAVRDAEARRVVAHVVGRGAEGYPLSRPVPRVVENAVDALVDRVSSRTRSTRSSIALRSRSSSAPPTPPTDS